MSAPMLNVVFVSHFKSGLLFLTMPSVTVGELLIGTMPVCLTVFMVVYAEMPPRLPACPAPARSLSMDSGFTLVRNLSFFKSHVNDMEGKNPHVLLAPTIDDPSPRAFNANVYLSSRLYVMIPINEARDWSSYVLSVPPYGLTAAAPRLS